MVVQCYCVSVRVVITTDDGEQARGEAGDKVFASTSTDNGVVCTGDSRPVVRSHHQAHFNELAGVARQPKQKGQQR